MVKNSVMKEVKETFHVIDFHSKLNGTPKTVTYVF